MPTPATVSVSSTTTSVPHVALKEPKCVEAVSSTAAGRCMSLVFQDRTTHHFATSSDGNADGALGFRSFWRLSSQHANRNVTSQAEHGTFFRDLPPV